MRRARAKRGSGRSQKEKELGGGASRKTGMRSSSGRN